MQASLRKLIFLIKFLWKVCFKMFLKFFREGDCLRADGVSSHTNVPLYLKEFLPCQRWVNACSRENFTVENVDYNTYICAVHWPGGKGPTDKFPGPLKANLSNKEIDLQSRVKRKAPKQRPYEPEVKKARKQLKIDSVGETDHECL